MLKIGLTGGIGSGKSSATEIFEKLGTPVIDADVIVHQLTLPGAEALLDISKQLGDQFINSQGELNRKILAQFVFDHPDKKVVLENILHPRVRISITNELKKLDSLPYVILAIPLLLETDFTELVDRILVINAPENVRIQRVTSRDGRSADEVKTIMGHQVDQKTRLGKADDILDNSGTFDELETLIKQLHNQYLQISAE